MLTDKLIVDNNKLIAEFTGRDKAYDERDRIYHYHESWDWLMPVIKKIESMGFYVSIMKSNITCCKDGGISPVFEEYDYKDKLETTWLAVTAFIKWYNKQ